MRVTRSHLVVSAMTLILAACAAGTAPSSPRNALMAARDQFVADLGQCSQTNRYDPENVAGVAENELAPRELQWRQCAYNSVRAYGRSNPSMTGMYEQLIGEDITMTNAIMQGTMTRSQRRARIEALLAQVTAAEDSQARATTEEQQRQMEQVQMVVNGMRGFH